MAKFGSVEEFYDPTITLTVRGKDYVPPLPSAELGLWCRTLVHSVAGYGSATKEQRAATFDRISNLPNLPGFEQEWTFQQHLLGAVYDELVADGVEGPFIDYCAWTVLTWIVHGEEAAQAFWESGGRPEARRPSNRAERRAAERTAGTSTDEATTTPSADSTSGTSHPSRRNGRRRRR